MLKLKKTLFYLLRTKFLKNRKLQELGKALNSGKVYARFAAYLRHKQKHWDLVRSKHNMAAFLSCSVSGRWEELPILMPLEGQKWHFRPLVSFILSYLLFDGAYVGNVAEMWRKSG